MRTDKERKGRRGKKELEKRRYGEEGARRGWRLGRGANREGIEREDGKRESEPESMRAVSGETKPKRWEREKRGGLGTGEGESSKWASLCKSFLSSEQISEAGSHCRGVGCL